MSKPKSLTELALNKQREAYSERQCKAVAILAPRLEREAAEILTLPDPPDVGPGGEVVREQTFDLPAPRNFIRDTLAQGANRIAEDASIRRADLLLQSSINAVAMGIDAAESVGAANSIEKMIAHQMAVAHEAALRMTDRGLSYEHSQPGDQVEACRCLNVAARLMGAFNDAALTLQRLRTGGSQTVTVQHVTVASGGQAVIGNVQPGAGRRRGKKPKNG
jgi:hypothetical protein